MSLHTRGDPFQLRRAEFLWISVGAVIGAGDLFRLSDALFRYGGAFLLPYLLFLFVGGVWLLAVEFSLGNLTGRALPEALRAADGRKGEFIGWAALLNCLLVAAYYSVAIGFVFHPAPVPSDHGLRTLFLFPKPFLGTAIIWAAALLVLLPLRGLQIFCKWALSAAGSLLIVLGARALALREGWQGLALLSPEWSALLEPVVWLEAAVCATLSLALGYGAMVALASRLPKGTELTNSAFIVALFDGAFMLLAAYVTLPILAIGGAPPEQSPLRTLLLSLPQAVEAVGDGPTFLLFRLIFLLAGLTTLVAFLEGISMGLREKFRWPRRRVLGTVCGLGFLLSLPFCLPGRPILFWFEGRAETLGLWNLDVIDHFCALGVGLVVVYKAWRSTRGLGLPRLLVSLKSKELSLPEGLVGPIVGLVAPLLSILALLGLLRVDISWLLSQGAIYGGGVPQAVLWLAFVLLPAMIIGRLRRRKEQ